MNYQDFIATLNAEQLAFVEDLNKYLMNSGCKASFEEKKSGIIASYKFGKPPKALVYMFFRKNGMLVRIYGENLTQYRDFLNTLPSQMIEEIGGAGDCKRLVSNGCSPKCTGYDFMIDAKHFQKCRYNCFEFLLTKETAPYIRAFAQKELSARG